MECLKACDEDWQGQWPAWVLRLACTEVWAKLVPSGYCWMMHADQIRELSLSSGKENVPCIETAYLRWAPVSTHVPITSP